MSARPWRVEGKHTADDKWASLTSFGSQETATARVQILRSVARGSWSWRIVNRDTAEIVHL